MRFTIMSVLVLAATSAPHAQEPDNPSIVQVGVFKVVPDGSVRGYAVDTGERVNQSFATRVWVANGGCRMGAGDRDAPEGASDAWDVRGRVTSMSAEHATIQVEWSRVRTAGGVIDGPRSTRELTVPFNQLIALDSAGSRGRTMWTIVDYVWCTVRSALSGQRSGRRPCPREALRRRRVAGRAVPYARARSRHTPLSSGSCTASQGSRTSSCRWPWRS